MTHASAIVTWNGLNAISAPTGWQCAGGIQMENQTEKTAGDTVEATFDIRTASGDSFVVKFFPAHEWTLYRMHAEGSPVYADPVQSGKWTAINHINPASALAIVRKWGTSSPVGVA